MKTKSGYIVIAIILLSHCLYSQSKHVTKGNQQWVQYYNQTRFSDKGSLLVDGGYRWKNDFLNRSQYIVRAAGAYHITPSIRVAAGFANLGTYTDNQITSREWRPHQELSMIQNPGKIRIGHRIRIEERFIEATASSDRHFSRFNWRFRYYFNLTIPLINNFPNQYGSLKLHVGDEILINAGKDIVYNVFDQNRILIGPILQVNDQLAFTFTYQGRFAALNLPEQYSYTHIYWLGIRHKIDLTSRSSE